MYTKGTKTTHSLATDSIIPPLPLEVVVKLPKYCPKPTKKNLTTLYYYWNKELIKENRELQKERARLKEELERAKKRITELEKEKEEIELQRNKFLRMIFKPKRKRNLSRTNSKKKLRGKQSYNRSRPDKIDERREATLQQCPFCNHQLSEIVDFYQRIIEDIPCFEELQAKVIGYTINRYWCKYCKKIVSAKPVDVLPKSRLGINTLVYVLYLKYRLRLSQPLIRENLKTYFNLEVSKGEIDNLLNKGQEVFKDKWQEIIETIRTSKAANVDETSWRINGQNHWLWAFVTDKAIRYTISQSRGKGIPQKALGQDFKGTVISDFYPAYNQFKRNQRCWVHLLRRIRELKEQKPTKQRIKINQKLNRIYQQILFFKSQSQTTKEQRANKANQIKGKLFNISRIKTADQQLQKVMNLLKKYAGELTVCIRDPNVSPDNNLAERALRPAVIMRKISGGSRSIKGAFTHEVNLSVVETLRKEQKQLFPAMKELVLNYITSSE